MKATELSSEALHQTLDSLRAEYKKYQGMGLSMNVSRGIPCPEQLDLSMDLLNNLTKEDCISEEGADIRNYGVMYGLVECRRLFSRLLDLPMDNIIIGGNSSFNLIYDEFVRLYCFGALGSKPWCRQTGLKWLCPVPGYDCHFSITEAFGFEMINIPMSTEGPDMDRIERLVAEDASIKGIWCVPQYTNPQGYCYSDEAVTRLAKMKTAAPDFRIFWDNAYCVHHLYKEHVVRNIYREAEKYGTTDRILYFASTAKMTFPGAAVSIIASGDATVAQLKQQLKLQIFSHDKINQMRQVKFLKDPETVRRHMEDEAAIIRPRFDLVDGMLHDGIPFEDLLCWYKPDGGYFITVDTRPGCAKRTLDLCMEAGVEVATAGSTFPYHHDPQDTNIRLAPTKPTTDELKVAIGLFCVCVQIAGIEKILADRGE